LMPMPTFNNLSPFAYAPFWELAAMQGSKKLKNTQILFIIEVLNFYRFARQRYLSKLPAAIPTR
jgi:hypothetical protein